MISILLKHDLKDGEKRPIAGAAVTELEKAVAAGDSDFVASQSPWLLSEDPDLDDLREQEAFADFTITSLGRRR